jgi:predicted metalloendopeptidase
MKIRKIYGAAALTVGLAALASCGGTNVQTSADPYADYVVPSLESVEPSGETKTITFLTTAGDDLIKVLESAKAKFEEECNNELNKEFGSKIDYFFNTKILKHITQYFAIELSDLLKISFEKTMNEVSDEIKKKFGPVVDKNYEELNEILKKLEVK